MAEQPDAAAPAAEGKKKRKLNQLRPQTRKKLKAAKELEVQLTPEEKQRRQEQKRQRELALKLRAEGRSYDPKVFKKKKQQKDGGKHPKAKVKIKSSQRNKAPYNVIILPIAWHQRKEESARILDASEKAQQILQAAGLTCRIDDGDKFSPGQKMKYWELRGVRVRLEIGPKESLAGTAVLAVAAATPGQVASKSSVKLADPVLTQQVKQALQQLGEVIGAGQTEDRQQEGQEDNKQQQQHEGTTGAADDADLIAKQDEQQPKKKKQKKDSSKAGGEAVGDVADTTSSKAVKKQKDRKQLKDQLASLMAEQQITEIVLDQVMQEANGEQQQQSLSSASAPTDKQRKQQKQQQQQLISGDALDDDFEFGAEDEIKKHKKTDKRSKKRVIKEEQVPTSFAGDKAQSVKVKKPKVVKF